MQVQMYTKTRKFSSLTYQVLQPSAAVKLSPALYRRPPTVHVPVGGVAVVVAVGSVMV